MTTLFHSMLPRYAADWRTLGLLALLTGLFIWSWFGGSAWLMIPESILCLSACVTKHNHTHCPTFRQRWLNRVLDFWLTLLSGTSTSSIRVVHQVRHHGRNQSPDDFVRVSLVANRSALHALMTYVPLVVKETWKWNTSDLNPKRRAAVWRAQSHERWLLWAFIAGGLILNAWQFITTFPLPWLAAQWFLVAINLPQHDACDPVSDYEHSRNVVGRFSNWLFLNNGFHSAHNECPAMHWSLLAQYHHQNLASKIPASFCTQSLTQFWIQWWKLRSA